MTVTEPFALHKAREALHRRDMAGAAGAARKAVAIDPTQWDAWFILGTAANALKDFEAAEQAYKEAADRAAPGSSAQAHMLILRAEPLICLGHPADAVASVRQAVELGINDARDLFLAGLALSPRRPAPGSPAAG